MHKEGRSRWAEEDHDLARPELCVLGLNLGPGVRFKECECGPSHDSSHCGALQQVGVACTQSPPRVSSGIGQIGWSISNSRSRGPDGQDHEA